MPTMFELVELAPGIHGAVSEITGGAVGNAAIIDAGDRTIVVDSFITAQAAAELRAEAVRLTGRAAYLLVNTHWHSDHTWGNQEFAGTPIVATRRTLELMIGDAPKDLLAWEAELDSALVALREKADSPEPGEREQARRRLVGMEHLKRAAPGFRLTLPDLLIDDRLVIEDRRRVEILGFGGGHTDSDLFAWMPEERVLVAGDLCWNRIHPRTQDGHPAAWADICRRLADLAPRVVHPGHGRPGGGDVPERLAGYLRTVADYVAAARSGADTQDLPAPAGSDEWEGIARMRAGVKALAARPA